MPNYDFYAQIIETAIDSVMEIELNPPLVNYIWFGNLDESPNLLTIYFAYENRATMEVAQEIGQYPQVLDTIYLALEDNGYPTEAIPEIKIGFVPEDEVMAAGGPYYYFGEEGLA